MTETLTREASGLYNRKVAHRPLLLSDNDCSYIAGDLADWLEETGVDHFRGAPLHPQPQSKIERWHQTLKNPTPLENYYLPVNLEHKIGDFVGCYNHLRYQESVSNLTPANVYFGRGETILLERERIKRDTFKTRRLQHRGRAAQPQIQKRQILFSIMRPEFSRLFDNGHPPRHTQIPAHTR